MTVENPPGHDRGQSMFTRVARADMRRSPFYRVLATLVIAWVLGTLAIALVLALFETRGLQVPLAARGLIYAVATGVAFFVRRKRRSSARRGWHCW